MERLWSRAFISGKPPDETISSAVYQQLNMMHKWSDISMLVAARDTPHFSKAPPRSDARLLQICVVAAGLYWSILYVAIGLEYELQLFGDGSIFSYSIAVEDSWVFHWHNIVNRVFVYLFSYVPAETYVEITKDPYGGIVIYGLLFFGAQLFGLIATWVIDRSTGQVFVTYACGSTACLCPLIFGFPTEVWMAHALFWPALALCHYAPRGIGGGVAVFVALLGLAFTHEGALIFVIAILATLLPRGSRDAAFMRAASAFLAVISIWALVKVMFPPDGYFAGVFDRAALHVFDLGILNCDLARLLFGTIAIYCLVCYLLSRLTPTRAPAYGVLLVTALLATYWLWFDHALHAQNRYYMRTVLLVVTPLLGALAAGYALRAENQLPRIIPILSRLMSTFATKVMARALVGALVLVALVHAVETLKFVAAWAHYKAAVRELAMGVGSDPALGDPQFVSSTRLNDNLYRLSWSSTTPFLSVLVAQEFAPSRLVLDKAANYFWITCQTATESELEQRAIPAAGRRLVRLHACLHR